MLEHWRERVNRRLSAAVVTRPHPLSLDRPTVSFTFDDVPVSAATAGAAVLEARGVRGTFYVCGALAGRDWDAYPLASPEAVAALGRRGHEIGCHTATHAVLGRLPRSAYLADVARNAALLQPMLGGGTLDSFAYPFGLVRLDLKLALQDRFRACRGIHGGLNAGTLDLGRLRAAALENATADGAGVDRLLDAAVRQRGWLVFYAHDVAERPTRFGVTPGLLAHAVEGALRRGCAVETVTAALDRAGVPPASAGFLPAGKPGAAHAATR